MIKWGLYALWAVHRGLDTWTEEHRKWVTREGNYWNEGKIWRDAYLVKTWLETKRNKPVKLRENPKISAYRCSLSGNGRQIFPVNISERQFNSWSYSKLWQNTTEYPNLKMKKKITLKLRALPLYQCSLGYHWTGLCVREVLQKHLISRMFQFFFYPKMFHFLREKGSLVSICLMNNSATCNSQASNISVGKTVHTEVSTGKE